LANKKSIKLIPILNIRVMVVHTIKEHFIPVELLEVTKSQPTPNLAIKTLKTS